MVKNYLTEFYRTARERAGEPRPAPAPPAKPAPSLFPDDVLAAVFPTDDCGSDTRRKSLAERGLQPVSGGQPVRLPGFAFCVDCGADLAGRVPSAKRCVNCGPAALKAKQAAWRKAHP